MNLIGFDFSCNKPACCLQINNKIYFKLWPLEMDERFIIRYSYANISIENRVRFNEGKTSTEKFRTHIKQSIDLSERITSYLNKSINKSEETLIAFEGSSFASKGDAALQLAGYRYVLISRLLDFFKLENIFTYAPLTIKSVAGCATKDKKGKDSMIEAFKNENIDHKFCRVLRNSPEKLKLKINYIDGVDDCVDAYFVLKTLKIKENIEKIQDI